MQESDIEALLRIDVPPKPARQGWEIDVLALIKMLDYLSIEHHLNIRFTNGVRRVGSHYVFRGEHYINLSQDSPIQFANGTFLHELAHAHQAEMFAVALKKPIDDFYKEAYLAVKGAHGETYRGNKFEQHAREFSKEHAHIKLLKAIQ